ncbi:MAG: DsrE family protein [Desulfovibrionaceae bacterium]|nr:DsrE family protein [Desulfovibrionaceae bacterium]
MSLNVVFHVDLREKQCLNIAFDNVTNYMNYLETIPEGKEASLVLLANGPAVNFFVKSEENSELEQRCAGLIAKGLSVRLCSNALRKFGIAEDTLWSGCRPVPGGIPELVSLQNEGYCYIKP